MAAPDETGRNDAFARPTRMEAERRAAQRRRAIRRRAIFAIAAVVTVEIVGTVGFHLIESVNWVDAFYFESMLATGQGPPFPLNTDAGKIFASVMGYVSVGSTLSAVVFTLGPILARLWREALRDMLAEARVLEHEASGEVHRFERELR